MHVGTFIFNIRSILTCGLGFAGEQDLYTYIYVSTSVIFIYSYIYIYIYVLYSCVILKIDFIYLLEPFEYLTIELLNGPHPRDTCWRSSWLKEIQCDSHEHHASDSR